MSSDLLLTIHSYCIVHTPLPLASDADPHDLLYGSGSKEKILISIFSPNFKFSNNKNIYLHMLIPTYYKKEKKL